MSNSLRLFAQFECLLIAVYHLAIGLAATFSPALAAGMAPVMYGVSLESLGPMRPEYEVIVRFIGAFSLAFGFAVAYAAWRPERGRWIMLAAVVFFSVRILDRFIGWDVLVGSLGSSAGRNLAQIGLMASFVAVLGAYLLWGGRAGRDAALASPR